MNSINKMVLCLALIILLACLSAVCVNGENSEKEPAINKNIEKRSDGISMDNSDAKYIPSGFSCGGYPPPWEVNIGNCTYYRQFGFACDWPNGQCQGIVDNNPYCMPVPGGQGCKEIEYQLNSEGPLAGICKGLVSHAYCCYNYNEIY